MSSDTPRRCWWHIYKWGEPFAVEMKRFIKDYITTEPGQFVKYQEARQRGVCQKCGFVKERTL